MYLLYHFTITTGKNTFTANVVFSNWFHYMCSLSTNVLSKKSMKERGRHERHCRRMYVPFNNPECTHNMLKVASQGLNFMSSRLGY